MHLSDRGLSLLKDFEGLRLEAYQDIGGVWTIGYGSTRMAGGPVQQGQVVTEREAEALLRGDVAYFERRVLDHARVPLTQNQFDALVLWAYNTGGPSTATLWTKLNAEDYQGAAEELVRWNKVKGEAIDGLTRRRNAERALFLEGFTQSPASVPDAPVIGPSPPPVSTSVPEPTTAFPIGSTDEFAQIGHERTQSENAMPIPAIVSAVLPTLIQAAPSLIRVFGKGEQSERNAKAAEAVAEVAVRATQAVNVQEATEKIAADVATKQAFQEAIEENWWRISTSAGEENIRSAREFAKEWGQDRTILGGLVFVELLSLLLVVIAAVGGWWVLYADFPAELKGAVITLILIGGFTGVKEFWLGSSRDSQRKTEMLNR